MNSQEMKTTENLELFWDKFCLFPTTWMNAFFRRPYYVYLLLIITYAIALVGIMPNKSWNLENLISLTHIHILPLGTLFAFWAYFRWLAMIPSAFKWIIQRPLANGSATSDFRAACYDFLKSYQADLLSKRKLVIASLSLFTIVSTLIAILIVTLGKTYNLSSGVFLLIFFCLWAFIAGVVSRPTYVTMKYVKEFFTRFQIKIQPNHPDNCGGLEPLGDFCFALSLPILIALIALTIVGIGVLWVPSWDDSGVLLGTINVFSQLSYSAIAVSLLFVVPLAWIFFFMPLWEVHRYMQLCKRKHCDDISNRITVLENRVFSSIDAGDTKEAEGRMAILQGIIQLSHTRYPVWPFRFKIFIFLLSPQVFSLIGLVISLYDMVYG